jgi:peptidoglycan/LPS O-acetylase OafA/YrhL
MLQKYNNFLQTKIFNFDLLLSLRGIMAMSVVFYHFFIDKELIKSNFAKYFLYALDGSGSVLVFFILSGYLMFKLFVTGRYSVNNLWAFYSARLNRILPLYWGVLILIGLFIYGVFWQPGNRIDFFKLFSFTQYLGGKDFVLEKYRWFSVTWSLVIEMQFYLIVPFLAWILMKVRNFYLQLGLLFLFSFLAIFDTILNFGITGGVIGFLNRSILGYFPFFLTGGMLALILAFHKNISHQISKFILLLPFLIFGLVFLPAYTRIFVSGFNGNWIFVIFTILIILLYESFSWDQKPSKWDYKISDILNFKKVLEMFGHLSFSIYMWHLFIIYQFGGFITVSNFGFLSNFQFAVLQKMVTLVAILIVSFCSFHTLEKIQIFKKPKS